MDLAFHSPWRVCRRLLCLREVPKPDDTADALAIAICHCHASGTALRQFLR